jgi:hypothetical protein
MGIFDMGIFDMGIFEKCLGISGQFISPPHS